MRCRLDVGTVVIYITPLIGFSNVHGKLSFWVGWLWYMFTFDFN